jgi:hypothetical protein
MSIQSLFQPHSQAPKGSLASLKNMINDAVVTAGNGHSLMTGAGAAFSKSVYAQESMSDVQTNNAMEAYNSMSSSLDQIINTFQEDLQKFNTQRDATNDGKIRALESHSYSASQRLAGKIAGLATADTRGFLGAPLQRTVPDGFKYIPPLSSPGTEKRTSTSLEAYDEKQSRNTVVYAVAYNMQAARQDSFGEAFFPTVVVTPDQFGYTISIELTEVFDEFRRDINGEISRNFGKRNIIHAMIDPSILRNDTTRIVPIFRDDSARCFVDPTLIAPKDIIHEGQSLRTSVLKMGEKFNILGLGQTPALLETGIMNSSDAIDPLVSIKALYMSVGTTAKEVIKISSVAQMTKSNFVYAQQGHYRQMNVQLDTDAISINKLTVTNGGTASTVLKPIVDGKYNVRLSLLVAGNINLSLGDLQMTASKVTVYEIRDEEDNVLDLKSGTGKDLADLFATAEIFGYDITGRRTNSNRRERGQLLETTYVNSVYGVPLLAPITVARPLTAGDANEASDLASLIVTTRVRASNAAVAKLLEAEKILQENVPVNGGVYQYDNELLGVARMLVKPFYEFQELDMVEALDSIKSQDRMRDLQAVIVNLIRDMSLRMYRDTGFKPVADAMAGGEAPTPTIIIGTDPVIAGYLDVLGDFRTLGNSFNVKVVQTNNILMKGKIRMSFGDFTEGRDGVPNALHFGNMAWKPEVVVVFPLQRSGSNSKEVTVQPSFLHIVNLPIMAAINVINLDKVVASKILIKTQEVPVTP